MIVMDLVTNGDLFTAGIYHKKLPRRAVQILMKDAIRSLKNLRNKNFIHGDIKPDNLFIDDECRVVLGDFGSAKRIESGQKLPNPSTGGTARYFSPQRKDKDGI